MICLKRIYEKPKKEDGARVLVDRLWPRGVSKEKARVDLWLREIAPSDALRRWFSHDPEKWEGFRRRYIVELKGRSDPLQTLRQMEKGKGTLTLLYAASDSAHNNARVLAEVLRG